MKKSKEAKFFCESCGSEVRKNDKTCPVCGKFFASVKCPKCGRTGNTEEFVTGCPTCGYAVNPDLKGNIKKSNFVYGNSLTQDLSSSFNKNNKFQGDSSLPIWVYISLIVVLVLLVVMLYSCLVK